MAACRQPVHNELNEVLIASSGGPPARFGLATVVSASPGNGPAVRAALIEYVTASQKEGHRGALYASVSGPARFVMTGIWASMADLEAWRSALPTSPAMAVAAKALPLLAGPGNTEIVEILLQNPA